MKSFSDLAPEVHAHIEELEAQFLQPNRIARSPSGGPDDSCDFDIALAGGGLSLLYAAWFAQQGLRVCVFDRRRIGRGNREWNISRDELAPLLASGLFSAEEVAALVELEYDHGIVRWHRGGTYPVHGVLDCVIRSEALLQQLRERCQGVELLDGHSLRGYRVGSAGVTVELENGAGARRELTARLLIDAMGSQSPHAAFDLACPTVGGVLEGLTLGEAADELNPKVGDILVSTEGIEEGRQHIWEGFPQLENRLTTYLFYYVEPHRLPDRPLQRLYERFFATLPRYKRGEARLVRPTYGFIPAYTRLRPMPASPCDRVVLVGDAASRHSPLTFCGFGSMVRSFLPVAQAIAQRLERDRLSQKSLAQVWSEPPSLQVMGALTLMMVDGRSPQPLAPAAINELLDAAFASLAEMGNETYAAFVRDEIGFGQFKEFMQRTAARRPTIYNEVFARLTKAEIARWLLRLGNLALDRRAS